VAILGSLDHVTRQLVVHTSPTPIEVPGHAAYPSGHATQAYLIARCMKAVLPRAGWAALMSDGTYSDKNGPVYCMARRIARNREVLGLHYPSDSVAGEALADDTWPILHEMLSHHLGPNLILSARAEWASADVEEDDDE
jgi:membrane-associated phospholipid phosphatase